MWKFFISFFLTVALFFSCSKSHQSLNPILDFPETVNCQWTNIDDDDEIYPKMVKIAVTDSSVFVLGQLDGKWLHEYSIETGMPIGHSLLHGQGPDDVLSGENLKIGDSRKIVYDLGNNAIKIFDADSRLVSAIPMADHSAAWAAWWLNDSTFLTCAPYVYNDKMARGIYLNKYNPIIKSSETIYAYEDMPEAIRDKPEVLCHQFTSIVSPDGKHFATATTLGGVLEIFDIESDRLIPVVGEYLFKVEHDNEGWVIEDGLEFGFSTLAADNEYLYGVYSGTNDTHDFTKIGVWKWDGTPVKLIETDAVILAMCLKTDDNTLYALTDTDNYDLRLSKLKL